MTMIHIASFTASNSTTAQFVLNNVPQTFAHLEIRGFWQGTRTDGVFANSAVLQFNSDTSGSNFFYATHWLWGEGNNPFSFAIANNSWATIGDNNNTNVTFNDSSSFQSTWRVASVATILDYTDTNKFKTVRSLSGIDYNRTGTAGGTVELYSNVWMRTNPITTLTISTLGTNAAFAQGSRFDIYGITTSAVTGA